MAEHSATMKDFNTAIQYYKEALLENEKDEKVPVLSTNTKNQQLMLQRAVL